MKFSSALGRMFAKLSGWQVLIAEPIPPKCVIIGAPHTAQRDFFATMLLKLYTALPVQFIAKKSLFKGPAKWVLLKSGGIPLERATSKNFVQTIVETYENKETWMIAISPEGTRGHAGYWRTGYYHIATGAQVPIVFGYVDYHLKVVGTGPIFYPTGDIDTDFEAIKEFYENITPKYPDKRGPIRLKPLEERTPYGQKQET